jgi:hypothetical protein
VGSSPISHPTSKPRTSVWGFFDGVDCGAGSVMNDFYSVFRCFAVVCNGQYIDK